MISSKSLRYLGDNCSNLKSFTLKFDLQHRSKSFFGLELDFCKLLRNNSKSLQHITMICNGDFRNDFFQALFNCEILESVLIETDCQISSIYSLPLIVSQLQLPSSCLKDFCLTNNDDDEMSIKYLHNKSTSTKSVSILLVPINSQYLGINFFHSLFTELKGYTSISIVNGTYQFHAIKTIADNNPLLEFLQLHTHQEPAPQSTADDLVYLRANCKMLRSFTDNTETPEDE
jgi:hypothetical protein